MPGTWAASTLRVCRQRDPHRTDDGREDRRHPGPSSYCCGTRGTPAIVALINCGASNNARASATLKAGYTRRGTQEGNAAGRRDKSRYGGRARGGTARRNDPRASEGPAASRRESRRWRKPTSSARLPRFARLHAEQVTLDHQRQSGETANGGTIGIACDSLEKIKAFHTPVWPMKALADSHAGDHGDRQSQLCGIVCGRGTSTPWRG